MFEMTMYTEEHQIAWRQVATSQGLFCMACNEPPALSHRDAFYDTGLCERCAGELSMSDAAPAA